MDAPTSGQSIGNDQRAGSLAGECLVAMNSGSLGLGPLASQGTIIDQLLVSQVSQPAWSADYAAPLYSSFNNHLSGARYEGQVSSLLATTFRESDFNTAAHQAATSTTSTTTTAATTAGQLLFDNPLSSASYQSDKLTPLSHDGLMIGRPNLAGGTSDRGIFTSSDIVRMNQQQQQHSHQELLAPSARSYSQTAAAASQRQQAQLSSNILDLSQQHQPPPGAAGPSSQSNMMMQQHSGARQQSRMQLQHQQQAPASLSSSRFPAQPRHLSEFLSSIAQQHVAPASSGAANFGSIGTNLDNRFYQHHGHQQRAAAHQSHSLMARQSIRHQHHHPHHHHHQENKPFQGPASNNAAAAAVAASSTSAAATTPANMVKRKSKLPFFQGSSAAASGQAGNGQAGNSLRLDLHHSSLMANPDSGERFSRKVFVGGLPPDIDEEEIKASFRRFGTLIVDWPHKAESKSYFPPKGDRKSVV